MLRSSGALQFGEFTLASGKRSPFYVDIKRAITRPEILREIARGLAPFAKGADRIAGVELGAVPIAAAVALETGIDEYTANAWFWENAFNRCYGRVA